MDKNPVMVVCAAALAAQPATEIPGAVIRPAASADLEALAALYLVAYPPEDGAETLNAAREEMRRTWAGEFGELVAGSTLVAEWDGTIGGVILTVALPPRDWGMPAGPAIIDLFVAREVRGRGVARALVVAAGRALAAADADAVVSLRVDQDNVPALALYARLGFDAVGAEA